MKNENELIKLLNKGDHNAFNELYTSYKYRICKFIYNMLDSHDETEEVFQSVFEKIWENRVRLKQEQSLNAYIYKIARNNVYDILRRRAYAHLLEKYLAIAVSDESEDTVTDAFDHDELKSYFQKLIQSLPDRRRTIFNLRYLQKRSYREIAAILNISENTVDSQIRNAIHFLRIHISKELLVVAIVLKIAKGF